MTDGPPWRLFEVTGVELEYMLVDADSLDVAPLTDEVLRAECGRYEAELELGPIGWSNELALHLIEFKTAHPATELAPLPELFQQHIERAGEHARRLGARLLPGAMHPWMDPHRETRLWPHENSVIYETFDRIFGCQGHGWSNLQSAHINLPFADDDEFGRLHAAIRVLLPILPALAASSPVADGRVTGRLDTRLHVYRSNCARIPSVTGAVVPEPVYTRADYDREIFGRMFADIAEHDPEGVLRDEFLNARGAIARFERGSIEIRVLDVQECPRADVAIVALVVAVLRHLCEERWVEHAELAGWPVAPLAALLEATTRDAEATRIEDPTYLRLFGLERGSATAAELWDHLVQEVAGAGELPPALVEPLEHILRRGPLARRLLRALEEHGGAGNDPGRAALAGVWRELADCLASGQLYP